MLNWTHRWFEPGGKWQPEQLADAFSTILLAGLEAPR
jgi:hypothetical protein